MRTERTEVGLWRDRFTLIAQPIVNNKTRLLHSVELLSKGPMSNELFFKKLSPCDTTAIAIMQMMQVENTVKACSALLGKRVIININISVDTLFNVDFINHLSQVDCVFYAFEINGFDCSYNITRLRKIFLDLKSLGHQLWLDDYGVGLSNAYILACLPWSGVKIDKLITWTFSQEQFNALVRYLNELVYEVTVEGVENKANLDSSLISGANFSQGFLWENMSLQEWVEKIDFDF